MNDREKVIKTLTDALSANEKYQFAKVEMSFEFIEMLLEILKEQEDLGTELTNAIELIHKKNERIKKLEEQIETLTKWRANAGAFD